MESVLEHVAAIIGRVTAPDAPPPASPVPSLASPRTRGRLDAQGAPEAFQMSHFLSCERDFPRWQQDAGSGARLQRHD